MSKSDYWIECASEALDEAGLTATPEQVAMVASHFEGAYENYGMAFYQPENPMIRELAEVKQQLKAEQDMVFCRVCNGRGRTYTQGPHHGCDSQCWKCGGNGKHKP